MNSRVPVAIAWGDAADGVLHEEAITRVVGPNGCLVVLPQDLALGQRLVLSNHATGQTIAALVVWKGNPRPEGWEIGIELTQPPPDFWGLEL